MKDITYMVDRASIEELAGHLRKCDDRFVPPLSKSVAIDDYARKIASHAARMEAWAGAHLVGLVAGYCNEKDMGFAFVTIVSILKGYEGQGIATELISRFISYAMNEGFRRIELEVSIHNSRALQFYDKIGFMRNLSIQSSDHTINLYFRI